jgi:hypothetical protein
MNNFYEEEYRQNCTNLVNYFNGIKPGKSNEDLEEEMAIRNLSNFMSLLSSIILFLLFLYFVTNRKFNKHPYQILGLTSGVESFYYFTQYNPTKLCDYPLPWLLTCTKAVAKVAFG